MTSTIPERDSKPTRRRLGAQQARSVIAQAAARLFAHRGYHGTTIEEIAAAAGYSPAAIYKYYRNKEDLFAHLWNSMADRLRGLFSQSATMDLPFLLRLRSLGGMLAQLMQSAPDQLLAFVAQRPHVIRGEESDLERSAAEHYRAYHAQVVAFMQQGIDEGTLRPGSAEEYALLFTGLMQALAYRWAVEGDAFDMKYNARLLIELFLRGAGEPGIEVPAAG